MDLIKIVLEYQTALSNYTLINEEESLQDVEGSCSVNPIKCSDLHQEKYVTNARHSIIQLQTSALQPSISNPFPEIRSKFVPYLSWYVVVAEMVFGPGKTDMRTICCLELFTAITTLNEQSKEAFVRLKTHV
jgi:hypothetical protein